ncbi:MAG: hypothetical protein RL701_7924 [Pseudomonadota bacterium]|jgi:uncharacterized membrane protein
MSMTAASGREQIRSGLRLILAVLMVGAGILHFTAEPFFTQIVPPQLPEPRLLVWISGIFEVLLGVALLPRGTRRFAGYGLIALFIAVVPANIYMAAANVQIQGMPDWFKQPSQSTLWLRLPLQLVFIAWAWWVSRQTRVQAR